jgi:hypothetical protein
VVGLKRLRRGIALGISFHAIATRVASGAGVTVVEVPSPAVGTRLFRGEFLEERNGYFSKCSMMNSLKDFNERSQHRSLVGTIAEEQISS